jgi:hypothetical protein
LYPSMNASTISTPPLAVNSSTLSTPPLAIDQSPMPLEEASVASISLLNDSLFAGIDEDSDVEVELASPKAEAHSDVPGAEKEQVLASVSVESSLIVAPRICPSEAISTIEDTEDTLAYDEDTYMEPELPGSPELIPSDGSSALPQQLPVTRLSSSKNGSGGGESAPSGEDSLPRLSEGRLVVPPRSPLQISELSSEDREVSSVLPVQSPLRSTPGGIFPIQSPYIPSSSIDHSLLQSPAKSVSQVLSPLRSLPSSKDEECAMDVESTPALDGEAKAEGEVPMDCASQLSFQLALSQSQDFTGGVQSGVVMGSRGVGVGCVGEDSGGRGKTSEALIVEGNTEGHGDAADGCSGAVDRIEISTSEKMEVGRVDGQQGGGKMDTDGGIDVAEIGDGEEKRVRKDARGEEEKEDSTRRRELLYESIRYSEDDGSPFPDSTECSIVGKHQTDQLANSKGNNSQVSEVSQLTSSAGMS